MPPFNFLAQYLKVLPAFCPAFSLHHFPFCFHIFIIFPYALFLSLFFYIFFIFFFFATCSFLLFCLPFPVHFPSMLPYSVQFLYSFLFNILILIFNQVPFIPLPSFFKYRHIGYLQAHTEH